MGTVFRALRRVLGQKAKSSRFHDPFLPPPKFYEKKGTISINYDLSLILAVFGCSTTLFLLYRIHKNKEMLREKLNKVKRRSNEKRFAKHASVQYNGQIYMTPQDFIESVLEAEPRRRQNRKTLTEKDFSVFKEVTPGQGNGSPQFFRKLRGKGIISYIEYVFLLSLLVKAQSGYRIAFSMYDRDNSQTIDKEEYLIMEQTYSQYWKSKRGLNNSDQQQQSGTTVESRFVDDEEGLQKQHLLDTTLILHFFGPDSDQVLSYEHFEQFVVNLQQEVMEMEFNQFAHGLPTITEVDFAKILLRYTLFETDEHDRVVNRLIERLEEAEEESFPGITFEEFSAFVHFLNNLTDFILAVRMFTMMNTPVSRTEFQKAVEICTGQMFSAHLVHVIFSMFDANNDGYLSYQEFISVMKDRLHRGFHTNAKKDWWKTYKTCLHREARSRYFTPNKKKPKKHGSVDVESAEPEPIV